jgi:hypothetical protein
LEDICLAAAYIFEHIRYTCQGRSSLLLSLGRTPALIHQAYEYIIEKTSYQQQHAVHLSFSGSPDRDIPKRGSLGAKYPDLARVRYMVTPEKLEHYCRYLDTKNILGFSKIYIVDVLQEGGGLNSFLEILNYYFAQRQMPLPQLEFLRLANNLLEYEQKPKQFVRYTPSRRVTRGRLAFKEDHQINFKAYEIETASVHLEMLTLHKLDFVTNRDLFNTILIGTLKNTSYHGRGHVMLIRFYLSDASQVCV